MIFRISKRSAAVREDDLHAYADNLIDCSRQWRVEQHLGRHPEDAERVAYFRHLNAELADLGANVREQDLDPAIAALREDLGGALLRQRQVKRTVRGAVASLLFMVAGSSAWMLSEHAAEEDAPPIVTAAVEPLGQVQATDAVFEISDGTVDEIKEWLSRQVEVERFSAPDLNPAGFTLTGARVVPRPGGPVIQIVYQSGDNGPLTFSVSKGGLPYEDIGIRDLGDRQLAVYWRRGSITYSLVGPVQHADLAMLADLVGGQAREKTTTAEKVPSSSRGNAEKVGVMLVDSTTDAAESSAPAAKNGGSAASSDATVKSPPPAATIEKIEEPKPL